MSLAVLRRHTSAELNRQATVAGRLEQQSKTVTLAGLAGSLAVGVGLAGMAATRIARPIRVLSRATRLIAGGQYDVPLAIETRDEVGELARALREMAQQLRQLETLKAELLANLSHDLRSPLSSITAAASLLQLGHPTPREARWLGIIQADSRKISGSSTRSWTSASSATAALSFDLAPTDLRQVVQDATEEIPA